MKANTIPGPGDGPERDAIREFLRHWHVAGPPPGLEADLRRTFRRRRSRRRTVAWLALAAGLALAALSQTVPARRPAPVERPVAEVSPRPAAPVASGSGPIVTRGPGAPARSTPARHARATRPRGRPDVVVEPKQAELLAQLGRELQSLRQAEPGGTPPDVETVSADAPEPPISKVLDAEARPYRAEWETVAGEWPFIHRAVPGSGR
jgi:hypothetical protein